MGNACANGDAAEKGISAKIDASLNEERKKYQEEIKILLLGAGESGKSTVAKQMRIIHMIEFTDKEKNFYKKMVWQNILRGILILLEQAQIKNIELSDENKERATQFLNKYLEVKYKFLGPFTQEMADDVAAFWKDPKIQDVWDERSDFLISDSVPFFLDQCEKYVPEDYAVSFADILHVRIKTTGVQETEFKISKKQFRMVDVGGQRNERKKWIHFFEDVTAIIFCVSLNAYDQVLEEDNTVNRTHEAVNLFSSTINNEWFSKTPIILFLNKKDLFEEKILKVDLKCCFPQYTGGLDAIKASKYISKKFLSKNKVSDREIYVHQTCATDTKNITFVFKACQQIILKAVMKDIFV